MSFLRRQPTSGTDQENAPPAPAVLPQPEFRKLDKGAAHFQFENGKQHAAQNVTHKQKADTTLTASVANSEISGKAVDNRFHGEYSADVRYQGTNIEAREDDLNMFVKGGQSKWITGQTKESIMKMKRAGLFRIWEAYITSGRNPSLSAFTVDTLKEDYEDTPEGLIELREFIVDYLAVTNGEDAG